MPLAADAMQTSVDVLATTCSGVNANNSIASVYIGDVNGKGEGGRGK